MIVAGLPLCCRTGATLRRGRRAGRRGSPAQMLMDGFGSFGEIIPCMAIRRVDRRPARRRGTGPIEPTARRLRPMVHFAPPRRPWPNSKRWAAGWGQALRPASEPLGVESRRSRSRGAGTRFLSNGIDSNGVRMSSALPGHGRSFAFDSSRSIYRGASSGPIARVHWKRDTLAPAPRRGRHAAS